jgi:hypothetical protein
MSPPAGKCGVKKADTVTFSGSATPGSTLESAEIREYGSAGNLLGSQPVPVSGASPSLFVSPEGNLSGQRALENFDSNATTAIRLLVTVRNGLQTGSGQSEPVVVDLTLPLITGAETRSREELVVRFSEPVFTSSGDSPVDWTINGNVPTGVSGTGAERTLRVSMNNRWGEDATPLVKYNPPLNRETYHDCVGHTLDNENNSRFPVAQDKTPPAIPVINEIDKKSATGDRVVSTNASPEVVVGSVTNDHTLDLFRETDGDPGLTAGDAKLKTVEGQEGSATFAAGAFSLPADGDHLLYARATDPAGNVGGADQATYVLDRTAPKLVSATADAQSVLVVFDDALTGIDNKDEWKISLGTTQYPVTGVSGTANQRSLAATNVPNGATLEYSGESYTDEAGNKAAKGSVLVTSNFMDPSTMRLDVQPETQSRAVGGAHTFSLLLTDHFGTPMQGFRLGGKVLAGPNAARNLDNSIFTGGGVIGTCMTNASGTCSLSYTTAAVGTDEVLGWIDSDNDSAPDEVTGSPEPSNASGASDVSTHDTVLATTAGGGSPSPSPSPSPSGSPSPTPSPTPSQSQSPPPSPEPLEARTVSLHADEEVVDLGRPISLGGVVAGSEACRSGAEVRVMRRTGETVENLQTVLADADGGWLANVNSNRNAAYSVEIPSGGQCGSTDSDEVTVKVRAAVDALVADSSIAVGNCARVKGRVAPIKSGAPVWLQQRIGGRWRSIDSDRLSTKSRFSFPACFDRAGKKVLRVKWMADGSNAASTSSKLRVRAIS